MIQNRLIKRNIGLCLKWKRFEGTVSVGSYVVFLSGCVILRDVCEEDGRW